MRLRMIAAMVVVALAAASIQLAGQRLDLVAAALFAVGLVGLLIALPRLMPPGFLRWRRGITAVMGRFSPSADP